MEEKEKIAQLLLEINQLSLSMGDIGYRYAHTMTLEQREEFIKVHTTIMKLLRDTKKRLTIIKNSEFLLT